MHQYADSLEHERVLAHRAELRSCLQWLRLSQQFRSRPEHLSRIDDADNSNKSLKVMPNSIVPYIYVYIFRETCAPRWHHSFQ